MTPTKAKAPAKKKTSSKAPKKGAKKGPSGPLTRDDKAYLRGLGHRLSAVIQVGHKGVSETLIAETKRALGAHELIKVKLGKNAPDEVDVAARAFAEQTGAEVVQVIGGVVLLYAEAPDPEDRKIRIPGR